MTLWFGVDLGGTNIKSALVRVSADDVEVLKKDSAPTVAEEGPERVVDRLAQITRRAVESDPAIAGIGVTVPGLFDPETGCTTFIPNLPGSWLDVPVTEPVRRATSRPSFIINDARSFGLAEFGVGAARGARSMAGLTLGTGVGGVIITEHGLHLGASGAAGEIGHQTVDPEGPVCGCGNNGCLEALACSSAIASRAGLDSAEEVFRGCADGDAKCTKIVEETGRFIGLALANVATVFTPEVFVIGGGVAQSSDYLLPVVREELRRRACLVDPAFLDVRPAALGVFAGAVGAALWARERADSPAA